jgi:hypothetical protein
MKQGQDANTVSNSRTVRGLRPQPASQAPSQQRKGSRFYFNFTGFPFPLGPFFERRTVRNEVRENSRSSFPTYHSRCSWLPFDIEADHTHIFETGIRNNISSHPVVLIPRSH